MFGEGLLEKLAGVLVGGVVLLGVGAYYGNEWGANARALARIQAELNRKNAELIKLQAEDQVITTREAIEAQDRAAEFAQEAKGLKKCTLDKSQAAALNKLIGG